MDYDIYVQSNNGGYYEVFINQKMSWDDAWVKCQNRGGKLAVIDSLNEKHFIVHAITTYYGRLYWENLWIGLRKGNQITVSFVHFNVCCIHNII